MVEKAFAMMDRDGSGKITVKDVAYIFDVTQNPEFLEHRKTKEEILTDFISNFEGARGDGDGIITKKEFFDYYTDLSNCTPSDEYFVAMMESTWQCPENEKSAAAEQTVNHLLREVKSRVFQLARQDPSLL